MPCRNETVSAGIHRLVSTHQAPAQSPLWEVPVLRGYLGKLSLKVPKSSMRRSSFWGEVFLASFYSKSLSSPWEDPVFGRGVLGKPLLKVPKFSMRSSISRGEYSVWFWQHFCHTGPSLCITDSLWHTTCVETKNWKNQICDKCLPCKHILCYHLLEDGGWNHFVALSRKLLIIWTDSICTVEPAHGKRPLVTSFGSQVW